MSAAAKAKAPASKGKPAAAPAALFDESEDEGATKLAVNKKFAGRYEDVKRKQELSRARDLGIDLDGGEDSEEEESEDDGALLTHDVDDQILKTLDAIRRKDPAIYKPDVKFFEEKADAPAAAAAAGGDKKEAGAAKEKTKAKKKMTAKDVLREQLVDAAERGVSDAFADDSDDDMAAGRRRIDDGDREKNTRIYDAEQAELRAAFLKTAAAEEDEDEEGGGGSGLVVKKKGGKKGGAGSDDDDADSDDDESVASAELDELKAYLRSKKGSGPAETAADLANPEEFLSESGVGSQRAVQFWQRLWFVHLPSCTSSHPPPPVGPAADVFVKSKAWKALETDGKKKRHEAEALGAGPVSDSEDEVGRVAVPVPPQGLLHLRNALSPSSHRNTRPCPSY